MECGRWRLSSNAPLAPPPPRSGRARHRGASSSPHPSAPPCWAFFLRRGHRHSHGGLLTQGPEAPQEAQRLQTSKTQTDKKARTPRPLGSPRSISGWANIFPLVALLLVVLPLLFFLLHDLAFLGGHTWQVRFPLPPRPRPPSPGKWLRKAWPASLKIGSPSSGMLAFNCTNQASLASSPAGARRAAHASPSSQNLARSYSLRPGPPPAPWHPTNARTSRLTPRGPPTITTIATKIRTCCTGPCGLEGGRRPPHLRAH